MKSMKYLKPGQEDEEERAKRELATLRLKEE